VIDQLILFYKEKKSKKWEDDKLYRFSNQTRCKYIESNKYSDTLYLSYVSAFVSEARTDYGYNTNKSRR
jgi:hypothetical protein